MDSLIFPVWKKILYSLNPLYLYLLEYLNTFHVELGSLSQATPSVPTTASIY